MPSLVVDNAITWVQFRIRGGWRGLAFVGGVYFVVFGGLLLLSVQMNPANAAPTLRIWTNILLGLQLAALVLFGGGRVTAAIRNDLKSRVIESHRLMPIHPFQVMLGYVFGATVQSSLIVAINLAMGFYTATHSGRTAAEWLMSNGIVMLFGVFVWCVMALCAFLGQWATAMMFIVLGGGFSTSGLITSVLPGLCVVLGPLIGSSVFMLRVGEPINLQYACSVLAQVAIGSILLLAASRRVARDDVPAFSPPLALLLLAACMGASAVGLLFWDKFRPVMFRFMHTSPGVQFATSLAFLLILANLPIASAGRLRASWKRRVESGDPYAGRAPVHQAVALLLSVLMCALLQLVAPSISFASDPTRHALTAMLILTTLMTIAMLQWYVYAGRRDQSAGMVASLYFFFVLVAPLLADLVRHALTDQYEDVPLGTLSIFSPLGALIELWTTDRSPHELFTAVYFQGGLALLAMVLYCAKVLRLRRAPDESESPIIIPSTSTSV